jgi:hypothetical protein
MPRTVRPCASAAAWSMTELRLPEATSGFSRGAGDAVAPGHDDVEVGEGRGQDVRVVDVGAEEDDVHGFRGR